jgi:hypothetical protein
MFSVRSFNAANPKGIRGKRQKTDKTGTKGEVLRSDFNERHDLNVAMGLPIFGSEVGR